MDIPLQQLNLGKQTEEVPFIGDVYDMDNSEFNDVAKKKVSLKALKFDKGVLTAEVILDADYSNVPERFKYVIVGARLKISDDTIKISETTAVWRLTTFDQVSEVDFGEEVYENTILISFLVSPRNVVKLTKVTNVSPNFKFGVTKKIENLLKQIGPADQGFNDFNELKQISNTLNKSAMSKSSQLQGTNWVRTTCYVIRINEWANKEVKGVETKIADLNNRKEMITFLKRELQLLYVSDNSEYKRLLYTSATVYVLHVTLRKWQSVDGIYTSITRLKEDEEDAVYCAVDLDILKWKTAPWIIKKFEHNQCVDNNVLLNASMSMKNLAYSKVKYDSLSPSNPALLEITCPGHYSLDCPNGTLSWFCKTCKGQLLYGFDQRIYCICGSALLSNYVFRCCQIKHEKFIEWGSVRQVQQELSQLSKLPVDTLLVLGPSGIGKSTWINSIANYITYKSFETARKSQVLAPIPVKFSYSDSNKTRQIEIMQGFADGNENLNYVHSATQDCKMYSFVDRSRIIHLIDTPGLGDTRGIDEDKRNVKRILNFLRSINSINGICILLKPNEARLTVHLKYCIKEILANLHRSCVDNLLFCFTHARSTFFRPGDTHPVLEALLNDINVDRTVLRRSYFMDNEAFRFLCCEQSNVSFPEEEIEACSDSWDKSQENIRQIFDEVRRMPPHLLSSTLSLNNARSTILTIIPLIVEISENIERNMLRIDDSISELRTSDFSLDELRKRMNVTLTNLKVNHLSYPRTVCTSEKCTKLSPIGEGFKENKILYVTHCHSHCYLTNVTLERCPDDALRGCAAMNGQYCQVCSCSWAKHKHINYEQIIVEEPIRNESVMQQIRNCTNARDAQTNLQEHLRRELQSLQNEKDEILNALLIFAQFLKTNAIIAYNDTFLDYLEFRLIELKDRMYKSEQDKIKIAQLEKMKVTYTEESKVFASLRAHGRPVDLDLINTTTQKLYALPRHGANLRATVEPTIKAMTSSPHDSRVQQTFYVKPSQDTIVNKVKNVFSKFYPYNWNSNNSNATNDVNKNPSKDDQEWGRDRGKGNRRRDRGRGNRGKGRDK